MSNIQLIQKGAHSNFAKGAILHRYATEPMETWGNRQS